MGLGMASISQGCSREANSVTPFGCTAFGMAALTNQSAGVGGRNLHHLVIGMQLPGCQAAVAHFLLRSMRLLLALHRPSEPASNTSLSTPLHLVAADG